jgi:hypothetical protein
MFACEFNDLCELILISDNGMKIIQNKNPYTQEFFKDKDDAIAWAEQCVSKLNDIINYDLIIENLEIKILSDL